MKEMISVCWFRRDLRCEDHAALHHALRSDYPVLPVFIFDKQILGLLPSEKDARVSFIHEALLEMDRCLAKEGSLMRVMYGSVVECFAKLSEEFRIRAVYANHDYEPYAIERDLQVNNFLEQKGIGFHTYCDQVIFGRNDIVKNDGSPYTVFTPYARAWKQEYERVPGKSFPCKPFWGNLVKLTVKGKRIPSLDEIGFRPVNTVPVIPHIDKDIIRQYEHTRNIPAMEGTSRLGVHLRFGTVSIRKLVEMAVELNGTWLNELIWREFFMMILFHFPRVVHQNFKEKYDAVVWRNNETEFEAWCRGETGYPLVDAGMRQLNETGWMHNRVRMVTASFLTKHLLIDWRWGEAYFAEKLIDYELASNNGNWQWVAGTGCDAAPYFRIFNPMEQQRKFDPDLGYIKRWIRDFAPGYAKPIVDHDKARKRALETYRLALAGEQT